MMKFFHIMVVVMIMQLYTFSKRIKCTIKKGEYNINERLVTENFTTFFTLSISTFKIR